MKELIGDYKATLDLGAMTLDLVLHINEHKEVTIDLPSQGAMALEASSVVINDAAVTFSITAMAMNFSGVLVKDKIEGVIKQMEQEIPVVFEKTIIPLPGNPSLVSTEEELIALANKEQGTY
ncbi:hypothetical protein LNQ81_10865 [Myroides sp. M-43]|nr:hypothetical protein [Myroides oncorhynchi]MCC9043174.1 hypothetical protein [Myroides oncorhynchi]